MKKLITLLFLFIGLVSLQAQSVDVTLGGNTSSQSFNIVDSDGDTIMITHGAEQTFFQRNIADTEPTVILTQKQAGDATLTFGLLQNMSIISAGIDNSDNDVFKICNTPSLSGGNYSDPNTLLRIHTQMPSTGIVDFNHQSRCRAWLNHLQTIGWGVWVPIEFEKIDYDEHFEFTPGQAGMPGFFTALEEGYYQVNARCEFMVNDYQGLPASGYVSIAIFKTNSGGTSIHSQGNNLQMSFPIGMEGYLLKENNAPNVSDVVYLQKGDVIDIRVYHSIAPPTSVNLSFGNPPNGEKCYVSIHKVS